MTRDYARDKSARALPKDYNYLGGDKSKSCPNCGHDINPLFLICPYCDFDFRYLSSYELCENCGRIVDECDEICHACGFIFKPHKSLPEVTRLCDEGFRLIEKYKIKDAKICFNKASKLDSRDPNPIVGNAYCLYHLGYYVLALKKCDEALDIDSESVGEEFYHTIKKQADSVKG